MNDHTHVNIQNPRAPLYPPERRLNERGFAEYGEAEDTYGTPFKVTQSSAVVPAVWIFVYPEQALGSDSNLHLSVDNVRWLRERLGEFLDDLGEPRDVPLKPAEPPYGYRWAVGEEECNRPDAIEVPLTISANGHVYSQGETDMAIPNETL